MGPRAGVTADGLRTCFLCKKRRKECEQINNNPAVYCTECRALIARHNLKKTLTVIRGGKQ